MLIWSGKIVHPPILERETLHKVQAMIGGRATAPTGHKPHRRQHPYALRGLVMYGLLAERDALIAANECGIVCRRRHQSLVNLAQGVMMRTLCVPKSITRAVSSSTLTTRPRPYLS
jgi:hypothetical protein